MSEVMGDIASRVEEKNGDISEEEIRSVI